MTTDSVKNIAATALCLGFVSYCIYRIWRGRKITATPANKLPIDLSKISYEDNPANWYLHKPGEK